MDERLNQARLVQVKKTHQIRLNEQLTLHWKKC